MESTPGTGEWAKELSEAAQFALLKALVADSTAGICIFDSQLRYVYINDALADINGMPAAAHLGKTLYEMVPGLAESLLERVAPAVHHRQHISDVILEGETPHAPGIRRAWRESWYPLDLPGGEQYTAVLVREISEEHRLAAQVAEAVRRKSTLLATVAHELRGPLSPLAHIATLMRETNDPVSVRLSAIVERQTLKLSRIAADLSEAASQRREMFHIDRLPVRLGSVIDDALATVMDALTAKGHTLAITASNFDSQVTGDAFRLTQVLENLLSNAIKYTPSGGKIGIGGETRGGVATVEVSDTGPGIASGQLAKVFDLFARGDQDNGDIPGNGIGLWLARELVEAHGGTLTVRNEAGAGVTFVISLPTR